MIERGEFKDSLFHIFYSDSVLLITTLKIAHSTCRDIFIDDNPAINSSFIANTFDFKIKGEHRLKEPQISYDNEIYQIWNNLLEKNENRDFLILHRDPYQHFISSFIEDFFHFDDRMGGMGRAFIYDYIKSISDYREMAQDFHSELLNQREIDIDLIQKYPSILEPFINKLLQYCLIDHEPLGHFSQWNSFICSLYNSNLFDKNKIKFSDIYEEPLEVSLKGYVSDELINPSIGLWKRYSPMFGYIDGLIKSNPSFSESVDSLLKDEYIAYDKIKNQLL